MHHPERLLNSILYLIERADPEKMGKIKLNKLLFFADAEYYLQKGHAFLERHFVKYPKGPVIHELSKLLGEWSGEYFHILDAELYGKPQSRFISDSNHHPDKEILEGFLPFLDQSLEKYDHLDEEQISDLSHDLLPWDSLELEEKIDLNLFAFSQCKPIKEEGGVPFMQNPELLDLLKVRLG